MANTDWFLELTRQADKRRFVAKLKHSMEASGKALESVGGSVSASALTARLGLKDEKHERSIHQKQPSGLHGRGIR